MTGKLALAVAIILVCTFSSKGSGISPGPNGIDNKSLKNWFMKDFKISAEKVTMADLEKGPGEDWILYHGDFGANHYSPLSGINKSNVKRLIPKWTYRITDATNLRSSPIVSHGVMYVTAANEIHAIDTATGQWLWIWQAYQNRSKGINRGVAIYEDKLFFSTMDCRLVVLNKQTGNVIWSREYAESQKGYFSTMAPLVIEGQIIMGVANNNHSESGFIASFAIADGKELWRFRTLPTKTELQGAPTWLTGSYDPATGTIYWPVGTLPDEQRTNLKLYKTPNSHHDSIVALNAKDGKLKWSTKLFDSLPIDWDSNEPLVLTRLGGKNLILQANRNGLFYKIDRDNGKILSSKPFVDEFDWKAENHEYPCPSVRGATNWMPPSLSRSTGLFYLMTLEGCAGKENQFVIKAIDPLTFNIKWTYPTRGTNIAAPGILSTGGNIVFSSEGSGHAIALDVLNGEKLWEFSTGRPMFASPITYKAGNQQYISIVAGSDVYTFGLYTAQ